MIFNREIRAQSETRLHREYNLAMKIQFSLARIGAGFGSAQADIFQTESLRILAERLSQWGIETRH